MRVFTLCYFLVLAFTAQINLTKSLNSGNLGITCSNPIPNTQTVLGLSNCQNILYMATIGIGSPPQNFTVQFDTGSNILWIPTQGCSSCSSNSYFNPSQSSTYSNPNNNPMTISYAGGSSIAGTYGSDVVQFYGSAMTNVTYGILFVSNESDYTNYTNGIIGLGFSNQYPNVFDLAYSQKQIASNVFVMNLAESTLYYDSIPETITSGTYYVGQHSNSINVWQVQSIGVNFGGIDFSSSASSALIVDSGTSLFYLNPTLYMNVYSQFFSSCTNSNGVLLCNCSNVVVPTITLYLKGIALYIYPQNYTTTTNPITKRCTVNFGIASENYILMGDILFRNYIVTFDKANSRVGFNGNYTYVAMIGETVQKYLQAGQIAMAAIGAILLIIAISMLCVMWKGNKQEIAGNGLEAELRNFSAY